MRPVAVLLVGACGATDAALGALEVGVRDANAFQTLRDGDILPLRLNTNGGTDMVTVALRTRGADPRAPAVDVEVTVEGVVLGGEITTGAPRDMEPDGDGFVLWDVNLAFRSRTCCHNCREAEVIARLEDASGRAFEGSARVMLARGMCPEPSVCCQSADECPDPAIAQVCQ
ncbi:MAG: hypothetical protein AABZ30_02830 [Myxococcota bacterium]